MSDFKLDIDLEVKGEQRIDRVINRLKAMGVDIDKVTHRQQELNGSIETFGAIKLNGVKSALATAIQRVIDLENANDHTNVSVNKLSRSYSKGLRDAIKSVRELAKIQKQEAALAARNSRADETAIKRIIRLRNELEKTEQSNANKRMKRLFAEVEAEKKKQDAIKKGIRDFAAKTAEKAEKNKNYMRDHEEAVLLADAKKFLAVLKEEKAVINAQVAATRRLASANRSNHQSVLSMVHSLNSIRHSIHAAFVMTGIHSLVSGIERIGHYMMEAVKEGIHFNDEIQKTKILLTSIGISDTHKSQDQIDSSGTAKEKQLLAKSGKNSEALAQMMFSQAAYTGQQTNQVFGVGQAAAFEFQSSAKKRGVNAMVQEPEKMRQGIQDSIQLAAILKVASPRGGPLQRFERILFSMLRGTVSDKGGDTVDKHGHHHKGKPASSAINFKPLDTWNAIQFKKEERDAITKLVDSGDRFAALQLIKSTLAKYGVSVNKLNDLFAGTLEPNVKATVAFLKQLNGIFMKPAYGVAIAFFMEMRQKLYELSQNSKFMDALSNAGKALAENIKPLVKEFGDLFDSFANDPAKFKTKIDAVVADIKGFQDVGLAFFKIVGSFLGGLTGLDLGKSNTLEDLSKSMNEMIDPAKKVGTAIRQLCIDLAPLLKLLTAFAKGIGLVASAMPDTTTATKSGNEQRRAANDRFGLDDDTGSNGGKSQTLMEAEKAWAKRRAWDKLNPSGGNLQFGAAPQLYHPPNGPLRSQTTQLTNTFKPNINVAAPKITAIPPSVYIQTLNITSNAASVNQLGQDIRAAAHPPLVLMSAMNSGSANPKK